MNAKLQKLEERFDKIGKQIETLENKLWALEDLIIDTFDNKTKEKICNRIAKVEDQITDLEEKQGDISFKIDKEFPNAYQ